MRSVITIDKIVISIELLPPSSSDSNRENISNLAKISYVHEHMHWVNKTNVKIFFYENESGCRDGKLLRGYI